MGGTGDIPCAWGQPGDSPGMDWGDWEGIGERLGGTERGLERTGRGLVGTGDSLETGGMQGTD